MVNNDQFDNLVDFSSHRLGNYRLVRSLGQGGFASVYLGEHLYLQRLAAIKVLRRALTEKELARFLEEARLLAKLSHPHIVRVLEFAVAQRWKAIHTRKVKERLPFLVMDYAPGGNLRSFYPAGARLGLDLVIKQIKQVASALQYAHERNIIHRDIKPENLLMNELQEVMLSDFGLALFTPTPDLLSLQGMAGTLAYTAPEQLQGKPSFASDQYSLAIIAYEWLAGSRPFGGADAEIILHQVSSPPPSLHSKNPLITPVVEDVISKALAKDPKQRYPTVQAFAEALEQASRVTVPHLAVTRQLRTVKAVPSPDKKDFPAFHYFTQKAAPASPEQNGSFSLHGTEQESLRLVGTSSSGQRNRLRMLQKVRAFWVHGVLKQSLHGASFITLGLDARQDVVSSPWSSTLHQAEDQVRSFAPGTTISEIYDQAGGELLILGEAGSGKTTLLLELARHLLDRAERDEVAPMPVVFLLSSWAEKQQSLEEWLIEELSSKYQVPRALGELWVRNEMLLPLLDGLDEVSSHARSACVEAINSYKKEHGLSSLVVCSRLTEYLLFPPRVLLRSAVVVQPLTMPQIESYLRSAGNHFDVIYQVLCEDPVLQRLVTTPLMLNIITLAYQDRPSEELLTMHSPAERYQRILKTYVEQMLQRHRTTLSHKPQQLIGWLTYLARQMLRNGQRVFYIEDMQPGWIDKSRWLRVYMWLAMLLPGAIIGALTGILSNDLFFHAGMANSVFIDGLYGTLMGYLLSGREDVSSASQPVIQRNTEKTSPKGKYIMTVLFTGLLSYLFLGLTKGWTDGLINGAFLGMMSLPLSIFLQKRTKAKPYGETINGGGQTRSGAKYFPLEQVRNGLAVGLVCGVSSVLTIIVKQGFFNQSYLYFLSLLLRDSLRNCLIGVLLSILLKNNDGTIHRAEIITWSWKRFLRTLGSPRYAITGMFIGVIVGLTYGLKQASQTNWSNLLMAGLSEGLFLALGYYLLAPLFQGISSHNLDNRRRYKPNEGIRRSLYYGLFGGLIGAFVCGLGYILSSALSFALSAALASSWKGHLIWSWQTFRIGFLQGLHIDFQNVLLLGLVGGLLIGLLLGGLACLQHAILRLILWGTGVLPLKLPRFLDYAADSVLLHRVGGGYIFIHRLLLEYFVLLDDSEPSEEQAEERSSSEQQSLVRQP